MSSVPLAADSMRTAVSVVAAIIFLLGLGAVVYFTFTREVILTVPPEFEGGVVVANGREVATIDTPEMIYLRFWGLPRELIVRKQGYEPVHVPLECSGDCYPEVRREQLVPTGG